MISDSQFVVTTGPNGGGKLALVKLAIRIEILTGGQIVFDGASITQTGVTERANMRTSYTSQQSVRFKGTQMLDLIRLAAEKKLSVVNACTYLSEMGLCAKDCISREANAGLSDGELKRAKIATVLARGTKLSMFDEPGMRIDLWSFQDLAQVFERMGAEANDSTPIISRWGRILDVVSGTVVVVSGVAINQGPKDKILLGLLGTASVVDAYKYGQPCPGKENE